METAFHGSTGLDCPMRLGRFRGSSRRAGKEVDNAISWIGSSDSVGGFVGDGFAEAGLAGGGSGEGSGPGQPFRGKRGCCCRGGDSVPEELRGLPWGGCAGYREAAEPAYGAGPRG